MIFTAAVGPTECSRVQAATSPSHEADRRTALRASYLPRCRKSRKVKAALLSRARARMGPESTQLDYVCEWLRGDDGRIVELARQVAADIGESCSRNFLAHVAHRLSPDASARIYAARAERARARFGP